MQVNIYRLRGIEKELKRIGDLLDAYLESRGVSVHRHPEVTRDDKDTGVSYVDEEADWLEEQEINLGLRPKPSPDE